MDRFLELSNTDKNGEAFFKNKSKYTEEKLHKMLDQMVQFIHEVQRICVRQKNAYLNKDLSLINTFKNRKKEDIKKSP